MLFLLLRVATCCSTAWTITIFVGSTRMFRSVCKQLVGEGCACIGAVVLISARHWLVHSDLKWRGGGGYLYNWLVQKILLLHYAPWSKQSNSSLFG